MSELVKSNSNTRVVRPVVDIVEKDAAITLIADMPGVSAEAVDLTLERNVLTLHGKDTARNLIYQRAFTLSRRIDRDQIEANVKDGVLTVGLQKAVETLPASRQIPVTTG